MRAPSRSISRRRAFSKGVPITLLLMALAIAVLAGCAQRLDEDRVALCRMSLPALNEPGSEITVVRVSAGTGEGSVRIDYMVRDAPAPGHRGRVTVGPRPAFAECRFSPVPFSEIEPRLESIVTETGPVSGASVYLLQRFWLRTPEAVEADPGR